MRGARNVPRPGLRSIIRQRDRQQEECRLLATRSRVSRRTASPAPAIRLKWFRTWPTDSSGVIPTDDRTPSGASRDTRGKQPGESAVALDSIDELAGVLRDCLRGRAARATKPITVRRLLAAAEAIDGGAPSLIALAHSADGLYTR